MQEPVTDAKGAAVSPRLIDNGDGALHPAVLNSVVASPMKRRVNVLAACSTSAVIA